MPECVCHIPMPFWICKRLVSFECPEHGVQTKPTWPIDFVPAKYVPERRLSKRELNSYRVTSVGFLKEG